MKQLRPTKRLPGKLAAVLILLVAWAAYGYQHNRHSASYVAQQFVAAVQHGGRVKVASLESTAFKQLLHSETTGEKNTRGEHGAVVTDNYYDVAKADGDVAQLFSSSQLSGAKWSSSTYKAANGMRGVSEIVSVSGVVNGRSAYSPSFEVDLVPSGNSWLVDGITPYIVATQTVR